jgi:hypothetical protein
VKSTDRGLPEQSVVQRKRQSRSGSRAATSELCPIPRLQRDGFDCGFSAKTVRLRGGEEMRTMKSTRHSIVVAALLVTIAGQGASAADKTELDAKKEKKARLECAAGNFREGVRLLAELWLDTKDPTHIYNQARCYEQSAQNAAAAARFIEYLRKAGPLQADDVKAIEKRIEELERKPGSTAQPTVIVMPAPAAAAPATAPLATAAPAPQPASPTPMLLDARTPEAPAEAPVYQRWWFWTGVGAVVAGGVVTAVLLSRGGGTKSPACDSGVPCAH